MTSNMWVTTSQIMREEACCRQVLGYSFQLGNVFSFNDALNTFNLRLYGVRHMVKDHSDSERVNLLPPHRLLFPISTRVLLYAPSHRQDSTYHGLCYISCGALAGTRNSSMGPPHGATSPINSKEYFYMHHHTDRIVHQMRSILEQEIATQTGTQDKSFYTLDS